MLSVSRGLAVSYIYIYILDGPVTARTHSTWRCGTLYLSCWKGTMSRPIPFQRPATKDDLDSLTEIMISASRDDPSYGYRFPYRYKHPNAFKTRCRQKCAEYLETSMVRLLVISYSANPEKHTAVAFSVCEWCTPLASESAPSSSPRSIAGALCCP